MMFRDRNALAQNSDNNKGWMHESTRHPNAPIFIGNPGIRVNEWMCRERNSKKGGRETDFLL